jgi:hypothetical protein
MSEVGHNTDVPEFIVTTEGEVLGQDTPENREIVRRINACVNACQDISTEELENGIIADMRQVLSEVVPFIAGDNLKKSEADNDVEALNPHYSQSASEFAEQKQKLFG